jgi:hypothetical protein
MPGTRLRPRHFLPLVGFVVPTAAVGYGVMIPNPDPTFRQRDVAGDGGWTAANGSPFSFREPTPEVTPVASRERARDGTAPLYFASAHPPPPPSEARNVGSGSKSRIAGLNDLTVGFAS